VYETDDEVVYDEEDEDEAEDEPLEPEV